MRLYQKMEILYSMNEQKSLEAKKKRLDEIRSLHKPIVKKELTEHALNYSKIKIQKETSINKKRKLAVLEEI